jgi:hypothetical protein
VPILGVLAQRHGLEYIEGHKWKDLVLCLISISYILLTRGIARRNIEAGQGLRSCVYKTGNL